MYPRSHPSKRFIAKIGKLRGPLRMHFYRNGARCFACFATSIEAAAPIAAAIDLLFTDIDDAGERMPSWIS
jgi:hypothetical protein